MVPENKLFNWELGFRNYGTEEISLKIESPKLCSLGLCFIK